ncbi:hypothetical protein QAD02_000174 [Eretmocerus hayati]|uniref:Uncharacterized protein n=1 Tax=Eretmocerus hayati TaxID=131215 RepID=A0ACC2NCP5_9HYME|nr:hypothetical protein QAD02_000174 [Eretmocerus hayati]
MTFQSRAMALRKVHRVGERSKCGAASKKRRRNGGKRQLAPVKKRRMVGRHQFLYLIQHMEKHTLFARSQITKFGPHGFQKFKKMWRRLAARLNPIGPCRRPAKKWKAFWTTSRRAARLRVTRYMKAYNRTGPTKPKKKLSSEDLRITKIFGRPGLGMNICRETGFRETSKPPKKAGDWHKNTMVRFMSHDLTFAIELKDEEKLNELVRKLAKYPPLRTPAQWKKTWKDMMKVTEDMVKANGGSTALLSPRRALIYEIILRGGGSTTIDKMKPVARPRPHETSKKARANQQFHDDDDEEEDIPSDDSFDFNDDSSEDDFDDYDAAEQLEVQKNQRKRKLMATPKANPTKGTASQSNMRMLNHHAYPANLEDVPNQISAPTVATQRPVPSATVTSRAMISNVRAPATTSRDRSVVQASELAQAIRLEIDSANADTKQHVTDECQKLKIELGVLNSNIISVFNILAPELVTDAAAPAEANLINYVGQGHNINNAALPPPYHAVVDVQADDHVAEVGDILNRGPAHAG